jgi:hypothetical protein
MEPHPGLPEISPRETHIAVDRRAWPDPRGGDGVSRCAQRRLYRLRPEPLVELDDWLAPYQRLWSAHLDKLETHLDRRRQR